MSPELLAPRLARDGKLHAASKAESIGISDAEEASPRSRLPS